MNKQVGNLFFPLACLEGIIVLAWIFATPSASSRAFFFGLSSFRLVLASLVFLALSFFLYLSLRWDNSPAWKMRLQAAIEERLRQPLYLASALISLGIVALFGSFVLTWVGSISQVNLVFYSEWLGPNFSTFKGAINRVLPGLVWIVVLAWQSLLYIGGKYWRLIRERHFWDRKIVGSTILAWFIVLVTVCHWSILSFRLTAFTSIPGWHWSIVTKTVTARHLFFVVLGIALILVVTGIFKKPQAIKHNLLLLVLLGYSIQIGMGMVDGKGIESLREKYYSTLHRSYTNKAASRDESVLDSMRNYEAIYSNMLFPSTKPPGVMMIYIGLERTINSFTHKTDQAERTAQLSKFIAVVFPIVSLAVVLLIFAYTKRFALPGEPETGLAAYLAPLLFILAPNIVLFPLFLDQAVYPALFLAASLPVGFAFHRQSYVWAALAGVCLYGAIFFSFSLLPIMALPVIYAVIQSWSRPVKDSLGKQAVLLLSVIGGVALAFLALRFLLNYDLFARYANAMSVVYNYDFYSRVGLAPGEPISLVIRVTQVLEAAYLNNLDFASLAGFPVFILFAARGVKAVLAILRRSAKPGEQMQGAFFLSYLALNAIGQMRGEAGRLWMYWVPVVVIFAAIEIAPFVRRRPALAYLLAISQFVTVLLTYQFQDLFF